MSQPLRPPAGAARQLQDVADGAERVQGLHHYLDLVVPLHGVIGAVVAAFAPLPPLIVFWGPRPVERALLGEQFGAVRRPCLHSPILLRAAYQRFSGHQDTTRLRVVGLLLVYLGLLLVQLSLLFGRFVLFFGLLLGLLHLLHSQLFLLLGLVVAVIGSQPATASSRLGGVWGKAWSTRRTEPEARTDGVVSGGAASNGATRPRQRPRRK